jgi:hypothetical protein
MALAQSALTLLLAVAIAVVIVWSGADKIWLNQACLP